MTELPPIEHAVHVPLAPEDAFDLFTRQLAVWWPLVSHSCSGRRDAVVRFEPREGGAVTEFEPDGTAHAWGVLTEWAPPRAFAMHWHPGQPAEAATRLRVSFVADGEGTRVQVHHAGWAARGDGAAAVHGGYQRGWPQVLGRLQDHTMAAPRPGDLP